VSPYEVASVFNERRNTQINTPLHNFPQSIGSFFSHARSCGQSTRNKNNGKVDNELNYNQTQITDKPYSSVKIIVQ